MQDGPYMNTPTGVVYRVRAWDSISPPTIALPRGRPEFRSCSGTECKRQRTKQCCHGRHHDRAKAQQASSVDGVFSGQAGGLFRYRYIDHHDAVFLHDTDEQNYANERNQRKIVVQQYQGKQAADAGGWQGRHDSERVYVAFIEHAQDDEYGKERGGDQEWLCWSASPEKPIDDEAKRQAIGRAKQVAVHQHSHLRPPGKSLKQTLDRFSYVMRKAGITKSQFQVTAHGLRHQFANDLYLALTDIPTPVRGGEPTDLARHVAACLEISRQLGHARPQISSAYISNRFSAKKKDRYSGGMIAPCPVRASGSLRRAAPT